MSYDPSMHPAARGSATGRTIVPYAATEHAVTRGTRDSRQQDNMTAAGGRDSRTAAAGRDSRTAAAGRDSRTAAGGQTATCLQWAALPASAVGSMAAREVPGQGGKE